MGSEEYIKLSELCNIVGVSRRCIQGYEKAGLLRSVDKNKYGHLLYDQAAVERAQMIHFMQEVGFQVKEIKILIDESREVVRAALARKLPELRREKKRLREVILEVEKMVGEVGECNLGFGGDEKLDCTQRADVNLTKW